MPDGKALQMGTSHFLGQNFSKPFEVKFTDKDNVEHFAWQTSWGVSWRLIGAMIMVHGDDKGLVLPPKVAPIQVVIIPIYYSKKDEDDVQQKADEIKEKFESHNIRVHVDARSELTPGFKFHDWELKGVPVRIEIGPKDIQNQKVVLATRFNSKKTDQPFENLETQVISLLENIQNDMLNAAKKILNENIKDVASYSDFKSIIDGGGFVKGYWCGNQECEEKIKEETGADIRVIPFDTEDDTGKCIICQNQSKSVPFFAKGY